MALISIRNIWGGQSRPRLNYLYNKGDECTNITGGWNAERCWLNELSGYTYARTVTKNPTNISIYTDDGNTYGAISARTVNPIDLTDYNHLKTRVTLGNGQETVTDVDISQLSGSYYVYCATQSVTQKKYFHSFVSVSNSTGSAAIYSTPTYATGAQYGTNYVQEVWLEK